MNENCCLCKCFIELYVFYWLLVVSLAILIALPLMFSVVHEHRLQEYSKCRTYQTLFKFTHRYKTIKKNKHNKFFIMLKCNSINVHSNTPHLATSWPLYTVGDFGNFLSSFAKSPRVHQSSWILNECNLYFKIVKYCILSEVCMIKTAPCSTVSPQM